MVVKEWKIVPEKKAQVEKFLTSIKGSMSQIEASTKRIAYEHTYPRGCGEIFSELGAMDYFIDALWRILIREG